MMLVCGVEAFTLQLTLTTAVLTIVTKFLVLIPMKCLQPMLLLAIQLICLVTKVYEHLHQTKQVSHMIQSKDTQVVVMSI